MLNTLNISLIVLHFEIFQYIHFRILVSIRDKIQTKFNRKGPLIGFPGWSNIIHSMGQTT